MIESLRSRCVDPGMPRAAWPSALDAGREGGGAASCWPLQAHAALGRRRAAGSLGARGTRASSACCSCRRPAWYSPAAHSRPRAAGDRGFGPGIATLPVMPLAPRALRPPGPSRSDRIGFRSGADRHGSHDRAAGARRPDTGTDPSRLRGHGHRTVRSSPSPSISRSPPCWPMRLAASLAAVRRFRRRCRARGGESSGPEALDRWRAGLASPARVASAGDRLRDLRPDRRRLARVRRSSCRRPLLGEAKSSLIAAVLLHELGHVRRGDFGWNLVWKLVQVLYWPHPLAWLVGPDHRPGSRAGVRRPLRPQPGRCGHVPGLVARGRLRARPPARAGAGPGDGTAHEPGPPPGVDRPHPGRVVCLLLPAGPARDRLGGRGRSRRARLGRAGPDGIESLGAAGASSRRDPTGHSATGHRDRDHRQGFGQAAGRGQGPTSRTSTWSRSSGRPIARGRLRVDPLPGSRPKTTSASTSGPTAMCSSGTPSVPSRPPDPDDPRADPGRLPCCRANRPSAGTVTDEQGRPIPGVRVEHLGLPRREEAEPHELAYMVDAITDYPGRMAVPDASAMMTFAYLYLSHPDLRLGR